MLIKNTSNPFYFNFVNRSPKKVRQWDDIKDILANCIDFSNEKVIEEIKEDPNETFTSINNSKIEHFDDSSLFVSPQILNKHQGKEKES